MFQTDRQTKTNEFRFVSRPSRYSLGKKLSGEYIFVGRTDETRLSGTFFNTSKWFVSSMQSMYFDLGS
jgi:hypothetical protein